MMSSVPLETCLALNKLWNNKFYYKAASCWCFYWRMQYYELYVCPSLRVEQLGSHWTDLYGIWYMSIFRKSAENMEVSLKSDKNNGHLMWRAMYFLIIFRSILLKMIKVLSWSFRCDRIQYNLLRQTDAWKVLQRCMDWLCPHRQCSLALQVWLRHQ
jgi:hypothetical protein